MVDRVAAAWADYRTLAGAKLRSDWQYRTGFFALLAASLLVTAMDFAGIAVVFTQTPALGEWSLTQVAFLYGVSGICFRMADFVVGSVERIAPKVRDGSFDQLLIRPVNVLVNLTASEFSFRRIGAVLQAATVFGIAAVVADVTWTPGKALLVLVMLVSGTVIAMATWVMTASISFWAVRTEEIANTFTYGGSLVTSYPLHIFEQWLRVLLTYVVPLVFVNYLPTLYLLDAPSPLGIPAWLRFASPLVAIGTTLVARIVWRRGLRHYKSTGS